MNLSGVLATMEELRVLMDECNANPQTAPREKWDRIAELYGAIEDIVHQYDGIQSISVESHGANPPSVYKDWIAAGYLSGRSSYHHEGRMQLVKLIGKVRARIELPGLLDAPASIDQLLRALRRFRECCQFIKVPPQNEGEVQDIIWIMLRSQFERVDREATLPKFGLKAYRPDFGIPNLSVLIEAKYVGIKTDVGQMQDDILADVPAYLSANSKFSGLIVFVYDAGSKLLDSGKFVEDVRTMDGVIDVIVMPSIGRN